MQRGQEPRRIPDSNRPRVDRQEGALPGSNTICTRTGGTRTRSRGPASARQCPARSRPNRCARFGGRPPHLPEVAPPELLARHRGRDQRRNGPIPLARVADLGAMRRDWTRAAARQQDRHRGPGSPVHIATRHQAGNARAGQALPVNGRITPLPVAHRLRHPLESGHRPGQRHSAAARSVQRPSTRLAPITIATATRAGGSSPWQQVLRPNTGLFPPSDRW